MRAIWPAPRGASIQHLAKRQEIDLAAGFEPGRRLAEDDEPVGLDHRGENAGAVAGKFARDPAAGAIGLEPGANVLAPLGFLAVVEAGAYAIEARRDLG